MGGVRLSPGDVWDEKVKSGSATSAAAAGKRVSMSRASTQTQLLIVCIIDSYMAARGFSIIPVIAAYIFSVTCR